MTEIGYIAIFLVVVLATGVVLWNWFKTKRTMQRMNEMIDQAIKGKFTEECFDESMLSALETKLAHYLAASTVSAQNLQTEKDNIKSLISDISHQTKTPIANIVLYSQLLGEREMSDEKRVCIDALENQAMKLQILIDALVKTSRLETGVISLSPVRAKLDTTIHSAVSQLLPKAEVKGIEVSITPSDAEAVFDPKWTEEAIVNLVDNAIKYTNIGGHISVTVESYQFFSCVNVTDDGSGISEDEQPKVFQRFYRGQEHQSEDGVGIGLYLVRQIAEGQGGYVRVKSAKNKNTTFSLYIPRD